jgi:hypothetical protein
MPGKELLTYDIDWLVLPTEACEGTEFKENSLTSCPEVELPDDPTIFVISVKNLLVF